MHLVTKWLYTLTKVFLLIIIEVFSIKCLNTQKV